MTGAERAKLSRIRAKPDEKRTADDLAFLSELEAKYKRPVPLDLSPAAPNPGGLRPGDRFGTFTLADPAPSAPPNAGPSTGTGPAPDDVWDRVIDATGDDDTDDDEPDAPPVETPPGDGASKPGAEGAGITGPEKPVPMSLEVSRGTAASAFLLMSSGWSMLGDRDPKYLEPSDEEMRLLSRVFASYAERFGWTHELDDAILLGTVLLVYNARANRAPKKTPAKTLPKGST